MSPSRKQPSELARIMADTSEEYFAHYVNNGDEATLLAFIEHEANQDDPQRERIGLVNQRLPELRA